MTKSKKKEAAANKKTVNSAKEKMLSRTGQALINRGIAHRLQELFDKDVISQSDYEKALKYEFKAPIDKVDKTNVIIEPIGGFCERFRKLDKLSKNLSLDESEPERVFDVATIAIETGEFEWINHAFNNSLAALALDKPEIKNFVKWFCFWNFNYSIMDYIKRERFQEQITKDLIKQMQAGQPLAIALKAFKHYAKLPNGAVPVTDEQFFQELVKIEDEAA